MEQIRPPDTQKLYKSSYRESTLLKLVFVSKFPAFYAVDAHKICRPGTITRKRGRQNRELCRFYLVWDLKFNFAFWPRYTVERCWFDDRQVKVKRQEWVSLKSEMRFGNVLLFAKQIGVFFLEILMIAKVVFYCTWMADYPESKFKWKLNSIVVYVTS